MMRSSLLLLFLPTLATCQQSNTEHFHCSRGEDGVLSCSFKVPEGTETVTLSDCFGDDCVDAHVTIQTTTVDDENVAADASMSQKEATANAETHTEKSIPATPTEYSITVEGETYHAPWSQYGPTVADALRLYQGPHSWEYGDWLITFAISIRGDALVLDRVLHLLNRAVTIFGTGEKTNVQRANAYMTMAETYIYDSYNAQYTEALDNFELSNRLFKEALDNPSLIPIGLTRMDVELNWADTLVRIAVLSIEEKMGPGQMTQEDMTSMAMGGTIDKVSEVTTRAEALLMDAIGAFRRQVASMADDPIKAVQRHTRLANALQNLASISLLAMTNLAKSNSLLDESITHYKRALELGGVDDMERNNAIVGTAESLYSLADGYLQEGKYDLAKATYRDTMLWYQQYNLASPLVQDVQFADADETLVATEQALEDYNSMLYGKGEIAIPNDHGKPGDPLYQADELYEADLHATLGALRMARNEMHDAIHHLASAIERYARDPVNAGRPLADARLNLAMAYFKQGDYLLSIEAHADALDVYQTVVGEGKNPLMDGLEDLLAQHGVDAGDDTGGGDAGGRLIDLTAYEASIINATAAAKKDEL